jgi:hypothetical protein
MSLSLNELAAELSLTPRRVRQLADQDIFQRLPDGRFEREANVRAYRIVAKRDPHEVADLRDELRDLAAEIDVGMQKLTRLQQHKRMSFAEEHVGPAVGRLAHGFDVLAAVADGEARRTFERQHGRIIVADLLAALIDVLGFDGVAAEARQ